MANILVIAGSDPTGQAGIQADLETLRALGHFGGTAITAVTAQNSDRVLSVNAVDSSVLRDQIKAILSQYSIDAVKIGLLANRELTYQTARMLSEKNVPNIVLDPVIRSSSGSMLLNHGAFPILLSTLMPCCRVVTPNLYEAGLLTGMEVRNESDMITAAQALYKLALGVEGVLVTGGHLEGEVVDIFFDGTRLLRFPSQMEYPENTRGTGCRFSTALACFLASGYAPKEAILQAKHFLDQYVSLMMKRCR